MSNTNIFAITFLLIFLKTSLVVTQYSIRQHLPDLLLLFHSITLEVEIVCNFNYDNTRINVKHKYFCYHVFLRFLKTSLIKLKQHSVYIKFNKMSVRLTVTLYYLWPCSEHGLCPF